MQIATETERKYDVPEGFLLPELGGSAGVDRLGEAETFELDATYFDTEDLRLARHRRTLRRRTGGSDAGWHLKTPGDGTSRTEHRLPLNEPDQASSDQPSSDQPGSGGDGSGGDGSGGDGFDEVGSDDAVPGELLAEVRAIVRDRPLRPVARLRTRRVETPLCTADGRTLALIAQDDVRADTQDGEQRWLELEVELVDGPAKVLKAVQKRLLAAGATPAPGPSKLARALGDRLRPPAAGAAGDEVVAYAREHRDALVANDPAVRRGEPEGVHKMRVAARRLRSTLQTYRDHWPADRARAARAELKWLAQQLGEVRDAQVLTDRFGAVVDRAGPQYAPAGNRIRERLTAAVCTARGALGTALDDGRYLRLLDELDALIDEAAARPKARGTAIRRRARKVLAGADALLDAADRHTAEDDDSGSGGGADDERFHEARKAFKRARYAVEVFVPTAAGPARKLVERLTRLQDVLGTHQDTVVARELLRDVAGEAHAAGEDGFPYGILHARQEQAGASSLAGLPGATRAARRPSVRRWLD